MISGLTLRNFKCFELQRLAIRNLTLLSGLNGMGKSTVLQALLLLRQSFLDGLLPETGLELNGSLVQMGTAQDVLYEGAEADEFEIGIDWVDGAGVSVVAQYHKEADVLDVNHTLIDRGTFDRAPFTDGFHYLRAERLGPRTVNALSDFQVRAHGQLGTAGEYVVHFLQVYGAQTVASVSLLHPAVDFSDLQSQVQAWLSEISPGTELRVGVHPEMDVVNLRYSFVAGEQRSRDYRATSVGFGITYGLPVIVALLSSKPGAVVLIENPEAHLHPRGQARMGELMARAAASDIQVIVETHSDHVLNGVRLAVRDGVLGPDAAALHYFSRVEGDGRAHSHVDSPAIDRNGRIDRWPEGFFDEWDRSLERLLTPREE